MPDVEQITSNVFKIVVGKFPRRIRVRYYRADSFSVTLLGRNRDDTPFNFDGGTFLTQFRAGNPRSKNVIIELENSDHVLGQSDEAIQYDTDQGNPAGTTKDEIHLVDATGEKFKVNNPNLIFDTEMVMEGDKLTLVYADLEIIYDITRSEA